MAKKPLKVTSTAKKLLKIASTTAKKTSEVASTSKQPLKENVSEQLKIRPPESSNDEEEESDSSSDEEDEPTKDYNKKNPETPLASSEAESESDSYETEPAAPPATVSTSASPNKKRQSEEAASTDVKRAKTESGTESTAKKKGIFERVWTENDEIVLLQGMIDFKNDTGKSPYENMSGFLQMVKKSISVDVKSGKQFSSKIWSLRRKYVGKRKNGVERSFTKPHDVRCLELAKTIWGTDKKIIKLEDDSLKIDGTVKLEQGWFQRSFLFRVITDWGVTVDEETLKKIWSLVPVETKKRLEEKFMSLQATQLKCVFQETELLNEVSHVMAKVD